MEKHQRICAAILGIVFGQLVSLLLDAGGVCAVWLKQRGVDAPTLMSTLNYFLLACFLLAPRGVLCRRCRRALRDRSSQSSPSPSLLLSSAVSDARSSPMSLSSALPGAPPPPALAPKPAAAWWKYAIIAAIDVEANYCVVKAYQFTSLTSVMLLDAWTIPCVMLLSRCVFRHRYGVAELVGVACALCGLGCNVLSDVVPALGGASSRAALAEAPLPWLGDVLVLCGSTLYAVSNVAEEHFVKRGDRTHYLGMLGLFGSIISCAQLAVLERGQVATLAAGLADAESGEGVFIVGAIAAFALTLFGMYTATAAFFAAGYDATLFNLSILTSDIGAVLCSALFFHEAAPHWLYFVGLAFIVLGVSLYSWKRKDTDEGGAAVPGKQRERSAGDARGARPTERLAEEPASLSRPQRTLGKERVDAETRAYTPECSRATGAGGCGTN